MREKREELNCQILEEEEDKTNIRKELSPFSAVACRRRTWGASSPSRRCPTRSSATECSDEGTRDAALCMRPGSDALDFLSESEEADQIMRELRVWTKLAQAKPLAMRRSVASLCVAWPQGGDLTVERAWGPRRAAALLWQLAGQLRKLHTAGIAHCCLCPRNIFLKGTKCEFKLGDFLPKLRLLSALGGKEEDLDLWLPAEVHQKLEEARRNPKGQALDFFAVDLWQLGAIGLWALTGHEPRRRADVQKLVKLDGSELTRVIAALLDDVPSKRPCAAAVRRRLGEDSILGQVDLPEDPSRSDREEPSLE
ncbi:unnamed protein product, partial [Effrenium voratum]